MISDEELEKLFQQWKLDQKGTPIIMVQDGFEAGFRKCEQMMRENWPSEDDIWNSGANFYPDHTERTAFCNGVKWLRDRLFGGGK